ncbi:YicC/YloC family endoribonuclease [Tundrisphaera lichenicola]|uniref:YicC/YloC family endoribonuclease n=1 Tax=Tundrisphaera lichenicola TaxID=2029860 RepID=UPI003EBC2AC1
MTGFGEARLQDERWSVSVEVRAVNNRHLKLNAKLSDPYGALEPDLERLVRETLRRGTVQLSIRVERPKRAEDYRLNRVALASYRAQLLEILDSTGSPSEVSSPSLDLTALLSLPGIVEERRTATEDPHEDWPVLSAIVTEALGKLQQARAEEGRAMAEELLRLGRELSGNLEKVAGRGPEVVSSFQKRLTERVQSLLAGQGVSVEPKDLIREVSIFAERADIAEEVIRLRAHLKQYAEVIGEPESSGRKLEFVVQEMGRETNTIGSKANDVEISRLVVDMKGLLEKIRELIQNVE